MKKVLIAFLIIMLFTLGISTISMANNIEDSNENIATNKNTNSNTTNQSNSTIENGIVGQVTQIKEKAKYELEEYVERYGSEAYGLTAYILRKVQIYSIPCCFLGVALSAIYQYVLGIRKLDTRDKGFYALAGFVTLFVICQLLPLVFVIVIKGWRG